MRNKVSESHKFQVIGHNPVVERLYVVRAFGNNHHIGPSYRVDAFAETSQREQLVCENRSVVVNEKDGNFRLHVTMLESVVKHNQVKFRMQT